MPAYRSEAEAEIRQAVVAHIRQHRPASRIIHEINASDFGNRIDVLAVGEAEIIAVEIKSAKDKLDRLAKQTKAMRGLAHHTVAAIHEKFLVEKECNEWSAHREVDGRFYFDVPPEQIKTGLTWVYPRRQRALDPSNTHLSKWRFPTIEPERTLPADALWVLWRDELATLCARYRLSVGRRANMSQMTSALRWYCTGRELTLGICSMLRARKCIEADAPITELAA